METSKLKSFIIVVLAGFFALNLGIAAATAQKEALVWISAAIFLGICLLLGRNVWILIPATLSMKGNINFLPGTPAPWHLMTAVAAGFFMLRVATRRQRVAIKWTLMETSLLLVALSILQALMRNPVGLSAFGGSDVAGGKPYFVFGVAFIAYGIIAMADTDIKGWRWAVILYALIGIGDASINALSGLSPSFAARVLPLYSNVSYSEAVGQGAGLDLAESRFAQIAQMGTILGLMSCTFWRPLAALDIRKPWRLLVAGGAVLATLLGGYRGAAASLFVKFVVGSALRKKWLDIAIIVVIGIFALAVITISGVVGYLPYGVQRVLSALPIEVDSQVALDAAGSSDDRFEMWRTALESDTYIRSKLLGDGFNMSARELQAMRSQTEGSPEIYSSWTEAALETGAYHGFHVEAIRNTGAIGLLFATITLIVVMRYAWQAIQQSVNKPYFGMVLFVCMPYLIFPFWYWLVFGSYKVEFPEFIALAGMIKLIHVLMSKEGQAIQTMSALAPGYKRPSLLHRPPQPLSGNTARP